MKQTLLCLTGKWIVMAALLVLLLASPTLSVKANPEVPETPATPPETFPSTNELSSPSPDGQPASSPEQAAILLPPLKAVLIVGPIDGDNGTATNTEKNNMELAAKELEARGVKVYRFYAPNNNWDQIKAAANGAHFLMYRGHGVAWSALPTPPVGGFALKDRFVSGDDIRRDLRLARNAIIMLYGCFTAGTSSSDNASISLDEARRRVEMYSDPFFDVGAGGYYADWFGDAFQFYVRALFSGMNQQQAYEAYFDYNKSMMYRTKHKGHASMDLWLGWDVWDNKTQYNNAFIGKPGYRLNDLFPMAQPMKNKVLLPVVRSQ